MPTSLHTMSRWLQDSQLMPIIISAVAAVLLMLSMRRRRKPSPPPVVPAARQRSEVGGTPQTFRRDMDDLLVELQELSRRISAEIDTRFAKLEAAMKDADRRIAVLHRLTRDSGRESEPDGSRSLPEVGRDGREDRSPASASPPAPRENGDVRHSVIYELADAGFSAIEIARDLGRTPGEVELILNLRRQSQARL